MDMQFTTRTQEALTSAMQLAAANGNPEVASAHILLALLQQGDDGIAAALLEAVGADRTALLGKTRELVAKLPSATGGASPQLSRDGLAAVQTAQEFAQERGDEYVSTEHLLIGLARKGGQSVEDALANSGANPEALIDALSNVRGATRVTNADPEGSFQALEKYGIDLTALAREGKLDPVIGRDSEIRRVVQVLSRLPRTTRF